MWSSRIASSIALEENTAFPPKYSQRPAVRLSSQYYIKYEDKRRQYPNIDTVYETSVWLQLFSYISLRWAFAEIGPWHTSDVMPFLKPIPRQTQSSPFGERSIHTSRLCKFVFISKYLTSTVDVEVKESMKAIEQRVPKLLSSEKWAYFALAIKRGIRRA